MMSKNGCRSGWTCVATMMLTISGSRALQTPSFYSEANALEAHRKLQTCGNCVWDEVVTPPSADMSCVVCNSGKQSETSASCWEYVVRHETAPMFMRPRARVFFTGKVNTPKAVLSFLWSTEHQSIVPPSVFNLSALS